MPRRPPEVREQQRTEALTRWLQGETQEAIAQAIGVHQTVVSDDILAALEQFRRERQGERSAMLGERLAELYLVKSEAWAAWERSKREAVATETTRIEGDARAVIKARVRREGRDGSVEFLTTILAASREIASLLGLYPPAQAAVVVSRTWSEAVRGLADAPAGTAAGEGDDAGQAT